MRIERTALHLSATIVVIVAAASATAIVLLYRTARDAELARLRVAAQSEARLIEAVARFDRVYSENYPHGVEAATLAQIVDAHGRYEGFGETGSIGIARREGDRLVFVLEHRGADVSDDEDVLDVALRPGVAEPMRRALSGESGTMLGPDYRGVEVLAAYEPIDVLDLGLVVKIDLAEVRAPFLHAGAIVTALSLALVAAGVWLLSRFTAPLVSRMHESERAHGTLIANVPGVVYRCRNDRDWTMLFLSEGVRELTGYAAGDFTAGRVSYGRDVVHPEDGVHLWSEVQKALHARSPFRIEYRIVARDGHTRWVSEQGRGVSLPDEDDVVLEGIISDVDALKQSELALERSNRTLRMLSACNQALVRAADEATLLDEVCRAIVETGGYSAAWVGFVDGEHVVEAAAAGATTACAAIRSLADPDPPARLLAHAVRTGRPVIPRAHDRDAAPGPAGVAALPLADGGAPLGVLAVRRGPGGGFDDAECALLGELAADMAFGVSTLRTRAAKERSDAELAASESRLRTVLEHAADAVLVLDGDGVVRFANPAGNRMLGPDETSLVGSDFGIPVTGDEVVEVRIATARGGAGTAEMRANDIEWEGTRAQVVSLRDVTEHKRLEERLRHDALHDALTGLANRTLFLDRLEVAIRSSRRRRAYESAVVFLDLDNFKLVNDSLGHAAGDRLLREAGRRLGEELRAGDTIARFGGDEFTLLLDNLADAHEAARTVRRVLGSLARPFELDDRAVHTSASAGIVLVSGYEEPGDVLRDADAAMYRAKREAKGEFVLFDADMHGEAARRLSTESALREAIGAQRLALHYQPIVCLDSGRARGLEALVRWPREDGSLVSPGEFIPVAEETGLIVPMGQWILEEACRRMRAWRDTAPESPVEYVAVNLSARQLSHPGQGDAIADVVESSGLPPECVRLEVTESTLMQSYRQVIPMLEKLRARGIKICMDDFGTGYSSLSYLRDLPVDVLKIDRSFVGRMEEDERQRDLVGVMAMIAGRFDLEVVAEGIETEGERSLLVGLGCRFGQGFLFSRPVPPEGVAEAIGAGEDVAAAARGDAR